MNSIMIDWLIRSPLSFTVGDPPPPSRPMDDQPAKESRHDGDKSWQVVASVDEVEGSKIMHIHT